MEVLGGTVERNRHSLQQCALSTVQQPHGAQHAVHEVHASAIISPHPWPAPPDAMALTGNEKRVGCQLRRPQTAPGRTALVYMTGQACRQCARQFGRLSLYDQTEHCYLGPKVLRSWERSINSCLNDPDDYLRQGDGKDLRMRNNLAQWLKRHPINREPPFVAGQAGVVLGHQDMQPQQTLFRYLYDNGTIDFITIRQGGLQNHIEWGKQVRPGLTSWGPRPSEVVLSKWLPIFLEGIRETQEPYRFLAIRGSESLIAEAGGNLHQVAADCVPPLKKALDCREPTTVAVALELIRMCLLTDKQVAGVWIYHLWQWAQIMNLFMQRKYTVNLGYNTRELASVRQLVVDVQLLLEEHGGEHATTLIRRYCRGVDPAVTAASQARRAAKEQAKPGHKPWQPFTLF